MLNRDSNSNGWAAWGRRAFVALVLLTLLAPAMPLAAQDDGAEGATSALRARIERDYEVLPVRDGVLLRPREEFRGVRAIEIADDTVAINGEALPEEAVRGWLGQKADDALALAELSVTERRDLFDLTGEVTEEGEAAAASEAPETGVVVEVEPIEPPEPPEAPEPAERPRSRRGSQAGFGSSVYVAPDEVVDEVVVFGGSALIDGTVDGDATVFGGRLEINGTVERDATVIAGSMSLGPHSEVHGDVAVVGGSLHRDPGSVIGGSIEQVEKGWHVVPWVRPWEWDGGWRGWSPWSRVGELFWALGSLIVCCLLIAIVLAVGRDGIERLSQRIAFEPLKAGVVGLLVAVLMVPVLIVVSVLLCISIIGIPIFIILLLAFIFLGMPALLVISLIGYAAVSHRVGAWLEQRFGWNLGSPIAVALTGLVALYSLSLVGRLLDLFGGPVHFFAAMFLLVGWGVHTVAGLVGFGAVFLHLWSRRTGAVQPGLVPPPPTGTGGPQGSEGWQAEQPAPEWEPEPPTASSYDSEAEEPPPDWEEER